MASVWLNCMPTAAVIRALKTKQKIYKDGQRNAARERQCIR